MKKEYDFSKAKKVAPKKVDKEAATSMVSFRMDNHDISLLKDEADRLGIGYQTLLKSILHRYITGEMVDKAEAKKIAG